MFDGRKNRMNVITILYTLSYKLGNWYLIIVKMLDVPEIIAKSCIIHFKTP